MGGVSDLVQYRAVDLVLNPDNTAPAKGDVAGRTVVVPDAAVPFVVVVGPQSLTAYGRTVYRTAGATAYEATSSVAVASRVLELLYVNLPSPVAAGTYWVMVLDKAGAPAGGDISVTPTAAMTTAGQLFTWEPPDGFLFTAGIQVALSTTPDVYTASAIQISTVCRTRDP